MTPSELRDEEASNMIDDAMAPDPLENCPMCGSHWQWIPVAERLPEPDVAVLTWDGKTQRISSIVHPSGNGRSHYWLNYRVDYSTVTHWMPLPANPL